MDQQAAFSVIARKSNGENMERYPEIQAFIADWFQRFDRLDPVDAFLPNLHPDVVWDMPDVNEALHGHARFKDWYAYILNTFARPTVHDLSDIQVTDKEVSFSVELRAKLLDGSALNVTAHEQWRYEIDRDGQPIITHYAVQI